MPNKKYIRGRALEYLIKSKLEKQGYFVTRSAGSHSVDLVAIGYSSIDSNISKTIIGSVSPSILEGHDILFVSSKKGEYIAPSEREELIALAFRYGATPMTTKKVNGKWELVKVE